MRTFREVVYTAIDEERAYQDARWDNDASPNKQAIEAWLLYMEDYLNEAKHIMSREDDQVARVKALHIVRKITAMGVACMEINGVMRRE